jgi:hypothetical protein
VLSLSAMSFSIHIVRSLCRAAASLLPLLLLLLLWIPGWSGVLYSDPFSDNGGNHIGCTTSFCFEISDSFQLSQDSTITAVSNIGLTEPFNTDPQPLNGPIEVNWLISTSPGGYGTVEAADSNAVLSIDTEVELDPLNYIYFESFLVDDLALPAGTYYLELYETTPVVYDIDWVSSSGSSVGYGSAQPGPIQPGTGTIQGPSYGQAFEIDGDAPDPASAVLCSIGFAVLIAMRKWSGRTPETASSN